MKFQILNNEQIGFYDSAGNLKATINVSNDDIVIEPVSSDGNIVFGENTIRDVEMGSVSTPAKFKFLGGGTISANGNTLYLGDSAAGDNVIIDGVSVSTNYFTTGNLDLSGDLTANNLEASLNLTASNAYIPGRITAGYLAGDGSLITNLTVANSDFVVRDINTPVRLYNGFQNQLSNRYFDSIQSNRLHGRENGIYLTVNDGTPFLAGPTGYRNLFNGRYEGAPYVVNAGETGSIFLDFTSSGDFLGTNGITYPQGQVHITFYNGASCESAELVPYYRNGVIGSAVDMTGYDPIDDTRYNAFRCNMSSNNYLVGFKLNITSRETANTQLNQIEYIGTRMTYNESGNFSKEGGYVRHLDPDTISLPTSDPKISGYMFQTGSDAIGASPGFQVICVSQG